MTGYHHSLLPPVMVRMGILSCLRSASLNGESVGIMITASHNPENDNGVKLADSNGGMMVQNWERMATQIANAQDDELVLQWIKEQFDKNKINRLTNKKNDTMVVHIGRDTRSHSFALSQLVVSSVVAMGGYAIDHGLVTTPQLHYYVLRSNMQNMPNALLAMSSGIGFRRDYIQGIVGSYLTLIHTCMNPNNHEISSKDQNRKRRMLVDCACGVGGLQIPILNAMLRQYEMEGGVSDMSFNPSYQQTIELIPFNLPGDGPLNESCGAEYVQKQQKLPLIHSNEFLDPGDEHSSSSSVTMNYVASLDGDADRIVFHYKNKHGKLVLLDGDKIAVLVSSFLQEEIDSLAEAVKEANDIKCGVVQTAYANGSSTNYLKVGHSSLCINQEIIFLRLLTL